MTIRQLKNGACICACMSVLFLGCETADGSSREPSEQGNGTVSFSDSPFYDTAVGYLRATERLGEEETRIVLGFQTPFEVRHSVTSTSLGISVDVGEWERLVSGELLEFGAGADLDDVVVIYEDSRRERVQRLGTSVRVTRINPLQMTVELGEPIVNSSFPLDEEAAPSATLRIDVFPAIECQVCREPLAPVEGDGPLMCIHMFDPHLESPYCSRMVEEFGLESLVQ